MLRESCARVTKHAWREQYVCLPCNKNLKAGLQATICWRGLRARRSPSKNRTRVLKLDLLPIREMKVVPIHCNRWHHVSQKSKSAVKIHARMALLYCRPDKLELVNQPYKSKLNYSREAINLWSWTTAGGTKWRALLNRTFIERGEVALIQGEARHLFEEERAFEVRKEVGACT